MGAVWAGAARLCQWAEALARSHHALSAASVLATVALVLLAGYLMAYLM